MAKRPSPKTRPVSSYVGWEKKQQEARYRSESEFRWMVAVIFIVVIFKLFF
ncbi:hypothetical protein [Megalodesulfovibrio paquesii]